KQSSCADFLRFPVTVKRGLHFAAKIRSLTGAKLCALFERGMSVAISSVPQCEIRGEITPSSPHYFGNRNALSGDAAQLAALREAEKLVAAVGMGHGQMAAFGTYRESVQPTHFGRHDLEDLATSRLCREVPEPDGAIRFASRYQHRAVRAPGANQNGA